MMIKKLILIFSIISLVVFVPKIVFAQSPEELSKQLQEKQAEIAKLESQLNDTRKQEKTLRSQLSIIDGQTKITELKIEETNLKIAKLEREITDLSGRIDKLSASVDTLSEVLLNRIVQTYKYGSISTIDLLFSSYGFADLIERLKYTQVLQADNKKALYRLQATKAAYNDQRVDKETRQTEAERLSKELEAYSVQLAKQKQDKANLLVITKNDEAQFQSQIARLKADADSIARAISNVGIVIGPVKKGQQIGSEGLTGCTSGPHLHFEVYERSKVSGNQIVDKDTGHPVRPNLWNYLADPINYLSSGTLGPPMQGYPESTEITVYFGKWYDLGRHTGIDIYDDQYVGTPILATADGTAYAISDSGCRVPGYDHGPAKGIVIDHGNGIVTLYWHLM